MTTTAEPPQTDEPERDAPAPGTLCLGCGARLADDQEWCTECGTARTMVHRPRGWGVPLAVVGTVTLLVLAGFAIALVNLSSEANRNAAALSTTTVQAASPAAAAPPVTGRFPGWPAGARGWTVELAASGERSTAEALARSIQASGTPVGILDSSRHREMARGQFIVFFGHYPLLSEAREQAHVLTAQGHPGVLRLVASPGG